jgi:polyhydroxyalkanoate synthesis regulator phasin
MFETIRKAMLIGLGAADMAVERVQPMIDEFVTHGEMSVEEGKNLFKELMTRTDERRRAETDRIRSQVREMLKDVGLADRTQVAVLEGRLDAIERKLDEALSSLTDAASGKK